MTALGIGRAGALIGAIATGWPAFGRAVAHGAAKFWPVAVVVLLVRLLAERQRHPVGEVVHRGDLEHVPHFVAVRPTPARPSRSSSVIRYGVAVTFSANAQIAARRASRPAWRQFVAIWSARYLVAECDAQRVPVRHDAVRAAVVGTDDHGDHLAVSLSRCSVGSCSPW